MATASSTQAVSRKSTTWRDPKAFVPSEVWEREIKLLVRDNPFDAVMAERLFGQAIGYLNSR